MNTPRLAGRYAKSLLDLATEQNQVGSLVLEISEKVLRKELSNKAAQENYIKTLAAEVKLN